MASFEKISGRLQAYGDSRTSNSWRTYSYIKLGDKMYPKLTTVSGLSGELEGALGENITIWLCKKMILGITFENGDTMYTRAKNTTIIALCSVLGLVFIPLCIFIIPVPVVLFCAWEVYKQLRIRQAINGISQLPNAVEVQVV